ncbi:MAG: hypothetical protein HUK40_19240 [Desulfobacter sp.]|nr:hypothetical protein [Desulfobacter sp.]
MELKSLILGLVFSFGAFAIKSGGGLAVLLIAAPTRSGKIFTCLGFSLGYAIVFAGAGFILTQENLAAHLDLFQNMFASGMSLHFLLAFLLLIWGVSLQKSKPKQTSRAWIPLVVPCPVCFMVILLSCSFVNAVYPDQAFVFLALYSGFILTSLTVAILFAAQIKDQARAHGFLGRLMLYIALYFMLSVIVIPQFADLDKIYRISISPQ